MSEDHNTLTGRCLCGDVQFEFGERITGALFCHCRTCQRAGGAAFSLNAIYARSTLKFRRGEATWYRSSRIAERGFCRTCGSPLFVRYNVPEWRTWIAVSLGAHDEPDAVPAERHFGIESKLDCIHLADGLPCTEYPEGFVDDVAQGNNDAYQALPRR